MPRISVVMPVKDRVLLLREALCSLIHQSLEDWEAIIVDDHSTEDIEAEVARWQDSRLRYVRNEGNPGIAASRNVGNKLVTSPLIAVADSDDVNLPRRLEVTVAAFDEHPEWGVFYGNMYNWNPGGYDELSKGCLDIRKFSGFAPFDKSAMFERDLVPNPTAAYRTELVQTMQYQEDFRTAEDYELFLSFVEAGVEFGYTTEPLVLYRRHHGQTTGDEEKKRLAHQDMLEVQKRHPKPL